MLNELSREIHQIAVDHGWWENPPSFGEVVALCHSELSEALEAYRESKALYYLIGSPNAARDSKPEGVAVEMADCLIRILDWAGYEGVDMDAIVQAKLNYNKTRPYRHGGKKL